MLLRKIRMHCKIRLGVACTWALSTTALNVQAFPDSCHLVTICIVVHFLPDNFLLSGQNVTCACGFVLQYDWYRQSKVAEVDNFSCGCYQALSSPPPPCLWGESLGTRLFSKHPPTEGISPLSLTNASKPMMQPLFPKVMLLQHQELTQRAMGMIITLPSVTVIQNYSQWLMALLSVFFW